MEKSLSFVSSWQAHPPANFPKSLFMISNANDSAILDLRIYQKHTNGEKEDEFLGGIREVISGLPVQQGGWAGFCVSLWFKPCSLIAITRKLDKLEETPSCEIEGHLTFQVTFVLSEESSDLPLVDHAITRANKQIHDMKTRPAAFDTAQQLVDSSSNVEATLLCAVNPWLPFLKSLELFVAAVDDIAEVRFAFLTVLQCGCE
jgi:hypothetical protein